MFLIKTQLTLKRINLHLSFFVNYGRASVGNSLQYLICLKSELKSVKLLLALSIVSAKIHYKRDDFNFDIVNFTFLDGDDPRRPSYGVYISQLIHFARVPSHVTDFNNRNKFLTDKLLKQGYRYH